MRPDAAGLAVRYRVLVAKGSLRRLAGTVGPAACAFVAGSTQKTHAAKGRRPRFPGAVAVRGRDMLTAGNRDSDRCLEEVSADGGIPPAFRS